MRLKFLGGIQGVTGSKTLLTIDKEKYLVDFGLFQGGSKSRENNWMAFNEASEVSAVFLTHAHIDHSGLLPRLWRDGFRGTIYCTHTTYRLCEILLKDSAKIQEEDAKYANEKNYSRHKPALPLYTDNEVKEVLKLFKPVDFHQEIIVSKNISIQFFWAGHIMGASFIRVTYKDLKYNKKSIVFSGDIGHKRNILLNPPEYLCHCDYLVLESTYGNRLHPRIPAKEVLGIYLNTILGRGGTAIIPSFSVGRTQDVLYLVKKLIEEQVIPPVPVILDSPLSKKANEIFNQCFRKGGVKEEIVKEHSIYPETLKEIESIPESRAVSGMRGPMIIISASGMLDGGRVVHHVKQRVTDKKNGIILVGFQPQGTKGQILLSGERILRLHKQEFVVNASIFFVDSLSAHGDYLDLIQWLKESMAKPVLTILNHGEPEAANHFKVLLESQLDLNTTIATNGEEYELDNIHFN